MRTQYKLFTYIVALKVQEIQEAWLREHNWKIVDKRT
jgi:hypothetical protein